MYQNFKTERVLCWRFLLEKYVPYIKYIKGNNNDSADAFSSILLFKYDVKYINITKKTLSGSYCVNKLDGNMFPLIYQIIDIYQRKYQVLVENCNTQTTILKLFRRQKSYTVNMYK